MSIEVFISYASEDEGFAENISKILEGLKIKHFKNNISLGKRWIDEVNDALLRSTELVVIVSPASLDSNWVNYEIGTAAALGKTILPFLTHPNLKMPEYLTMRQYTHSYDKLTKYFVNKLQEAPISAPQELQEEVKVDTGDKYFRDVDPIEIDRLMVPGEGDLYSSFKATGEGGFFLRLKVPTTSGWVPLTQDERKQMPLLDDAESEYKEVVNEIYLIRDPIRLFEIQIGQRRAERPGGDPGMILLDGDFTLRDIKILYPAMIDDNHSWMRMVLAEICPNPEVLEFMYNMEYDERVKQIITRNPFTPNWLRTKGCLFCDAGFLKARTLMANQYALIICNDYPYGPFFHYIVMPNNRVHSWDSIDLPHLEQMNILIWEFLKTEVKKHNFYGSAGVRIGFNSSIRHLVVGKSARSSAGASIAHVHKQIWGMPSGSVNLGDHLARICQAYSNRGIDYLHSYYNALMNAGLVLWQDENVVLYIPIGQISIHELQVMVKRKNTNNYLELNEDELRSLSQAELKVIKLYSSVGINSFNEITISKSFTNNKDDGFRVIFTYITREVDLAVSELNLLYVVDKHPFDTLNIMKGLLN